MNLSKKMKAILKPCGDWANDLIIVCNWIDQNKYSEYFSQIGNCGFLYDQSVHIDEEDLRLGGSEILLNDFCQDVDLPQRFGLSSAVYKAEVKPYFIPFGNPSNDGSVIAAWKNTRGDWKVVLMGSMAMGILCDEIIDLLRLFGIGYSNISYPEDYSLDIDEYMSQVEYKIYLNYEYRFFIEDAFDVKFPKRASEIVTNHDSFGSMDGYNADEFTNWCFEKFKY